jgi:hypothetical protein
MREKQGLEFQPRFLLGILQDMYGYIFHRMGYGDLSFYGWVFVLVMVANRVN